MESSENHSFFTNKYTNIAKGIAILLMLFHHLGLSPDLNVFENPSFLYTIALQCKVCVSIFLILSGYGLNISFNKKSKGKNFALESIHFMLKHLLKLMINFWIVFAIFVCIGQISGLRTIQEVYGENLIKNFIIDILGLANLFGTPTYNITWWFMSLIIIFYVLFPILKYILRKSPIIFVTLTMFVWRFGIFKFYTMADFYFPAFCIGMILSQYFVFDKIKKLTKNSVQEILSVTVLLCFAIYERYKIGGAFEDIFLAFSIICFSNSIIASLGKIVTNVFEFLGKHSSNMFMTHTFTFKYFCTGFFLKLKYWFVMYIVMIIFSLLISIVIELMKKAVSKYSKKIVLKFKPEKV